MNVIDELKQVIEVKIEIKEDVLAEKLFEQAVDPLMQKLVDLIPSEIDNAFYASKKAELKVLFAELLKKEINKVEDKIDDVLGQNE